MDKEDGYIYREDVVCVCVCVYIYIYRERERERERRREGERMEYDSAIKKNEIMPAATGMDLEIIILSEVSHRETNIMCCHSCGI